MTNQEQAVARIDTVPILESAINCGLYFVIFLVTVLADRAFPDWTPLTCVLVLAPYLIVVGLILLRRMMNAPYFPIGSAGIALSRLVPVWAVLFVIACLFAYSNGLFNPLTQVGMLSRLGTIVGAPVAEEMVFRGALLTSLNRTQLGAMRVQNVPVGVAVGAVVYSFIHLIIFSMAGFSFGDAVVSSMTALIMGLVFGVLYVRSENVWYGVFLHALINFGHWG